MKIIRASLSQMGRTAPGQNVYERVLATFPSGIRMAFAYGSAVFQQVGQERSRNMLDFIFVVDKPEKWHADNCIQNVSHYSFLSKLGPEYIADIQNNHGAGLYFNTLVPFEERLIKYGVISTDRLVGDLTDWDTLYVSGRLHKPVFYVITPNEDSTVAAAVKLNLKSAVNAALLLLPEKFTEIELYTKLASLSYSGDFRMQFGEDKGKVDNIVRPNVQHFHDLYHQFIKEQDGVEWNRTDTSFVQCTSTDAKVGHLKQLPATVHAGLRNIVCDKYQRSEAPDRGQVIQHVAHHTDCSQYVAQAVRDIVVKSSWSQSVKGIVTAGLQKSVRYSWAKVNKMVKGMMRKS